jgi:hypothetical protein
MKKRGWKVGSIGLMAALAVTALAISAEALTFQLNNVFSGFTPAGSAPWATAVFTTTNTTAGNQQVTLTFTGSLGASGQFISELDFNVNPTLTLSSLSGSMSSCTTCSIVPVGVGEDKFQADGDGKYDIGITFDTSDGAPTRFNDSDVAVVVFTYTGAGTFNDQSFNFLSTPAGGAGPFHTAAHVQGIPATGCSGWISDTVAGSPNAGTSGDCTPVPEPITMFLGGTGLLTLGYAARKRLFGGRLASAI